MHQDSKYWAKNDELLLADKTSGKGPVDPFKTIYQTM
jgi:hypothetical protein